ncbi:MAG: hypothetical protein H7251_18530, partial [Acetobacteraceae bacterium]|nr:hypothetical protein [Acetobacteraceae bacterium]
MHLGNQIAPSLSEHMLVDTVDRLGRTPSSRVAVVLHLSRLRPPAPRPHHRRVARALLQDTAQRHDGQVFVLRNGDQVLICLPGVPGAGTAPRRILHDHPMMGSSPRLDPRALPPMLVRLMQIDAPDPTRLTSIFTLPAEQSHLAAYAAARLAETVTASSPEDEGFGPTAAANAIGRAIQAAPHGHRLRRQTGVMVSLSTMSGFRQLFAEYDMAGPGIAATGLPGSRPPVRDPFLLRHLTGALDQLLLHSMLNTERRPGPFAPSNAAIRPRLHINLSLAGLGLPGFTALLERCRHARISLAVEFSLLDASADPDGFFRARDRLHRSGVDVVLDQITHLALAIAAPATLGADLYKLDWSPRLRTLDPHDHDGLNRSMAEMGLDRIVLLGANGEDALLWGLSHGIRRFQGRHVAIILAAERVLACPHS